MSVVVVALLAGCASRSEREALRQCAFSPRSTRMQPGAGDSMVVSVGLEIRNPGPSAVVLDSFQATAFTTKPLARFSHGKLRRIESGRTDTVDLRFSMAKKDLMGTAFSFVMSPPDSIGIEGTAWIPNFFGLWTSRQEFKSKFPYRDLAGKLKGLVPGFGS